MPDALKMKLIISVLIVFSLVRIGCAQPSGPASRVNPFIGTDKSDVYTKWGSEGGTYPGAVAPWGAVQLTPETNVVEPLGYHYSDNSIYFFSCTNHSSGYPNGSSGRIAVMPIVQSANFEWRKYNRPFSHQDEKSEAGYYRVVFQDTKTEVESTATERTGMFRITFPADVTPLVFVGDAGAISFKSHRLLFGERNHAVFEFSEDILDKTEVKNGYVLHFAASHQKKVITLKLSISGVSFENALANLNAELGDSDFDQIRKQTFAKWNKELSVVEVQDSNTQNKTIFYTALYHSFLLPRIVSDSDRRYRGKDGQVHQTTGTYEYAGFSPWDTFRSLHPLLCLLKPERQTDMIQSMMDVYFQSGRLPVGPMTGNHVIPVIVDSYLKGIRKDSLALLEAMEKSIVDGPSAQSDLKVFQKMGYVPSIYPESVTKTVEYAYDDWALAQFTGLFPGKGEEKENLLAHSFYYRNLFCAKEGFLLPRNGDKFIPNPGTIGYKEGDKWIYSFFVPQNAKDLINLMGGTREFAMRLDSALQRGNIVFDNETAFQIPYLFNYANSPSLTHKWVRKILRERFCDTPGGIPGNDDLGSMSSWYVLSAMGIYPVCPGRPVYDLGSPIFRKVTINQQNKKQFVIESPDSSDSTIYVAGLTVNGTVWNNPWIAHSLIASL